MPSDKLDIGGSFRGQVSVAPEEHPEDRAARLRAEQRTALIEDCKGIAVFAVLLVGLVAVGILSAYEGFFAGESLGLDRRLTSNTSKTRSHSLFRQGCMLHELIPNMPNTG